MELVKRKVNTARKALKTLQELLDKDSPSIVERDAAIQRFEYTFEAVWKAGKLFLREVEGLEIGSPKGVMRSFLQVGLLAEDQTALGLSMVDDRNLTSHTYNESLADQIYGQLGTYSDLMAKWVSAMEKALESVGDEGTDK
ncbi:MAG: HI0074 family nucleotidyltransferase substrate-binding subunit [Thermodesulfobacteriota bacterium]|nr:HI0074 family nucleotidyltransferase substrate-binding subunit [Thermodesulfobacteriota bacterium]